jgi:hypothetical protein
MIFKKLNLKKFMRTHKNPCAQYCKLDEIECYESYTLFIPIIFESHKVSNTTVKQLNTNKNKYIEIFNNDKENYKTKINFEKNMISKIILATNHKLFDEIANIISQYASIYYFNYDISCCYNDAFLYNTLTFRINFETQILCSKRELSLGVANGKITSATFDEIKYYFSPNINESNNIYHKYFTQIQMEYIKLLFKEETKKNINLKESYFHIVETYSTLVMICNNKKNVTKIIKRKYISDGTQISEKFTIDYPINEFTFENCYLQNRNFINIRTQMKKLDSYRLAHFDKYIIITENNGDLQMVFLPYDNVNIFFHSYNILNISHQIYQERFLQLF